MIIGSQIHFFDEIDSTNEYAKKIIGEAKEGTVVFAETQTEGRGRLGRKWFSPEGGIYMSVILFTDKPLLIPVLAGVVICETFNNYDILLGIKWPNDLLLNDKKVAGVLIEVIDSTVILGLGINLNIGEFPDDLKNSATSIFLATKKRFDKMMVYNDICRELESGYDLLKKNKVDEILQKWRNFTVMFGKTVSIETPDKVIIGRVIDIGRNGALILSLPDGKIEKVIAGECRIVKQVDK